MTLVPTAVSSFDFNAVVEHNRIAAAYSYVSVTQSSC